MKNFLRIAVAFFIVILVISFPSGCHWLRRRQEEKAKIVRAQELEEQLEMSRQQRQRDEQWRLIEERWTAFSRSVSGNNLSFEIVYSSIIWGPCFLIFLFVYSLANGAYVFIAMSKTVSLAVFLLAALMLLAEHVPELAEWSVFRTVKSSVESVAVDSRIPIAPDVWLVSSGAFGVIIETLARMSRQRSLTVNVTAK